MPTPIDGRMNLHTVHSYGTGLGVECRGCCHRKLIDARTLDPAAGGDGNMTVLQSLKFVCSACGSREWAGWLFHEHEEAKAFAGKAVSRGPAFR